MLYYNKMKTHLELFRVTVIIFTSPIAVQSGYITQSIYLLGEA